MKTLFGNARLIDPESGTDAPGWLLVGDGTILDRGDRDPPAADVVVECGGRCLRMTNRRCVRCAVNRLTQRIARS
jgi:dihydroorotase